MASDNNDDDDDDDDDDDNDDDDDDDDDDDNKYNQPKTSQIKTEHTTRSSVTTYKKKNY